MRARRFHFTDVNTTIDSHRSARIMAFNYTIHDAHDFEFRVHFTLSRNPYVKSRDIQIEVDGPDVILKGSVTTYYQKQMAQHSLRQVDGIRSITNELTVTGRRIRRGRS